jgi:hypothetical protein
LFPPLDDLRPPPNDDDDDVMFVATTASAAVVLECCEGPPGLAGSLPSGVYLGKPSCPNFGPRRRSLSVKKSKPAVSADGVHIVRPSATEEVQGRKRLAARCDLSQPARCEGWYVSCAPYHTQGVSASQASPACSDDLGEERERATLRAAPLQTFVHCACDARLSMLEVPVRYVVRNKVPRTHEPRQLQCWVLVGRAAYSLPFSRLFVVKGMDAWWRRMALPT